MTPELHGKTALVTGGARGIGRAIALGLAQRGADVALLDVSDMANSRQQIEAAGGRVLTLQADVSQETEVRRAFELLDRWTDCLDIVVNNAGILSEKPLLETSMEEFDKTMAVNLRGTFLVGRESIRRMATFRGERRDGSFRVINIASELAYLGRPYFSPYCASKAGVIGLTRAWAREFAPLILVNGVAPGPVDTPMIGLENMSAEWREKETQIPLGRVGQPEEIAHAVAFLAGPGATFFSGQTIGPNGGAVMC